MAVLRRCLAAGVLIAIPSILIGPILISGKMLYGSDVISIFYYSRIVIADAFRSGRLPVWDPHVMAGFPLLAGVQGAVFYPPTWCCVLMSAGMFWTLSAWAHLVLAGVFAHRWLQRGLGLQAWSALAGAVVFMMSGYSSGHVTAGHVNYVWAYPWIPAVLWRFERFLDRPSLKRGVLLSVVLALLFLSGVPQYVFFVGLLLVGRGLQFILGTRDGRKARAGVALQAIGWLVLGLASCAPQLFPTLELVGQMQRGEGSSTSFFGSYALKPRQLGELVLPPSRNEPLWWETCGYVGGAVFLLTLGVYAGKHPQRHLWAGVALVAVLVALGDSLPVYPGFVAVVPGAGGFRGPGRYLLLFTVAMVALAGMGFDALWNRGSPGLRILVGALAVAGVIQLADFGRSCIFGMPEEMVGRYGTPTEPIDILSPGDKAWLREHCGLEGRVASRRAPVNLIGECQASGLDQVCGYEPMMLRRYAEVINAARGAAPDMEMVIVASVEAHPVTRMLATRYFLDLGSRTPYPDSMPRSWVVNNAVVLEEKGERLRTIGSTAWDPLRTVILESYPNDVPPVPTEKPAGRARVLARGPGFYQIEAENDADAYLVLSEAYYPGWSAEVDGRATDVLPANHLLQAVRLPAGKHVVRFRYRSRFLALGFAVTALAGLVPVCLLVRGRWRQLPLKRLPGAP